MKGTLVQFGAGNIGRSFVGQVFSRSGYEVVFVDIDERIVRGLNERGSYRVIVKHKQAPDRELVIENVRGIDGRDAEAVAQEIAEASYVATSVGKGALPHVYPTIAQGLLRRREQHGARPVDIIIAENVRNGAELFRTGLGGHLPADYPMEQIVGLVETSIGKMVPIMRDEDVAKDPLWVFAEPYNTLIVDRQAFKNPLPDVDSLEPVRNIQAYVDRKLFVHNLGHAAAAYFGFQHDPGFTFIYQCVEVPAIAERVRAAMQEAADALNREYPADLPSDELAAHIDDLLDRFGNASLGDTVFRVGRDLYRKLDKEDRLLGAMLLARRHRLASPTIADAVVAGTRFRAGDEHGELYPRDLQFVETEAPKGLAWILSKVCRLSEEEPRERAVRDEILAQAATYPQ
jgi:mannitol-1-phosphate 5-dehydrogenase